MNMKFEQHILYAIAAIQKTQQKIENNKSSLFSETIFQLASVFSFSD